MKIIENMPAAEYHAVNAASASRLKDMRRSAQYCRYRIDHQESSPALEFGALFHSVALEPDLIDATYATIPKCDRRTKAGKAAWEFYQAECKAKKLTPADADDMAIAKNMTLACEDHPMAKRLLRDKGRNEVSCFWKANDIECKLRADRLVEVPGIGTVVADLKTTTDASPEAFKGSIYRFGYQIQGAFYLHGLAACGIEAAAFCIVAVEKDAPHGVACYRIDDDAIEQGWRECQRLLSEYARCVKTGIWPGYDAKIIDISIPTWAMDKEVIY